MARVYPHISEQLSQWGNSPVVVELGCGGKQYRRCFSGTFFGLDLQMGNYEGEGPDVCADAQVLPLASESVDLVFAVATLLIVPQPKALVAECRRVLRPGGRLALFDYNWWVARRLQRQDPNHRHCFSSTKLAKLLRQNNFTPTVHYSCTPVKGAGWLGAWAADKRLRALFYWCSNWVVLSGQKTP